MTAARRAGINTLVRTANAHLLALIEGGRPEKIAERNWPYDSDAALLVKGAVSTMTTTSAASIGAGSRQHFVASLTVRPTPVRHFFSRRCN